MGQKEALLSHIAKHPVIYAARSFERSLGLPVGTPGYYVITNSFPGDKGYAKRSQGRLLILNGPKPLDTHELLEHPEARALIKKLKGASLLVFKNTPKIERIAKELNVSLLNPESKKSSYVEEKITQLEWLGGLSSFLPPHKITTLEKADYEGIPFIVQFNHAHSGEGTILVQSEKNLKELKDKFPKRDVRITDYIRGPIFTSNNVVCGSKIIFGNISYQITGLSPFTDMPFATIGNDWGLAKRYLSKEHRVRIEEFAEAIGKKLAKENYRGLFGIDVVLDQGSNRVYLLEINARQPASTSYESGLQHSKDPNHPTIFEAHLMALLGIPCGDTGEIWNGAQLLQRATKEWRALNPSLHLEKFSEAGFHVFASYETDTNAEILRIQSPESVMESHGKLNDRGRKIVSLLPIHALVERTMTDQAMNLAHTYAHLPLGRGIKCPYFNNKRGKAHGALRAFSGKGTPMEIIEEAKIKAKQSGLELSDIESAALSKFLVDKRLGVDCSGLAYHLLDAETSSRGYGSMAGHLIFPNASFFRKIIAKIRNAENTSVAVLTNALNSREISVRDASPGDFVSMLNTSGTADADRDHILIITKITYDGDIPKRLAYIHSIEWPSDGAYNHGIAEGAIEITDPDSPIENQRWIERDAQGEENPTYARAKNAESISIRRLKWL